MKCEFCGGNLSLEDAVCPYCGQENTQAKKHVKAMKHFQGEFEKTRKGVYHHAGKVTAVTVRVTVIAVMIVVFLVLLVAGGNSYSIMRDIRQRKAEMNRKEYTAVLDGYLEEENYQAFVAFIDANSIDTYEGSYEKYDNVKRVAQDYCYVYNYIMDTVCPPEYQEPEQITERLSESLEYFYSGLEYVTEEESVLDDTDGTMKTAILRMEENVELLLRVYLDLTEEEAESLKGLSEARRAVLIEEAMADGEK